MNNPNKRKAEGTIQNRIYVEGRNNKKRIITTITPVLINI
jgi:hypothetical protein